MPEYLIMGSLRGVPVRDHRAWLQSNVALTPGEGDVVVVAGGTRLFEACASVWPEADIQALREDLVAGDADGVLDSYAFDCVVLCAAERMPSPARMVGLAASRRGIEVLVSHRLPGEAAGW